MPFLVSDERYGVVTVSLITIHMSQVRLWIRMLWLKLYRPE